ncbi:MAG: GNAT family N-acetyltransferase [Rhodobacteraceae bacterium]|nr:GNAT family N-acetyltransferase [Paracoccaceae bacterium]
MKLATRAAVPADAGQMCDLINRLIGLGGGTAHRRAFDARRMRRHYLRPDTLICCTIADEAGAVLGFQALVWPSVGPGFDLFDPGWAIIASFTRAGHQGRGIGRAMFAATLKRARAAGVRTIDASISGRNTAGLAYYHAMGFVDFATRDGSDSMGEPLRQIRKRYDLTGAHAGLVLPRPSRKPLSDDGLPVALAAPVSQVLNRR